MKAFTIVLLLAVGATAQSCSTILPATGPLPDLRVDSDYLAKSWVIKYEDFDPATCEVIESEGILSGGSHKVVRFSVSTPNYGYADVTIGDPLCHVAANDGFFEYATCHQHYHFRNYATYELFDSAGNIVGKSAKRGFCMIDIQRAPGYDGPSVAKNYKSCGTTSTAGYQGVTMGWSDIYDRSLPGQLFVLDGITPGDYNIKITVNPRFCVVNKCPKGDAACAALPSCKTAQVNTCNDPASKGCCDGQRGFEVTPEGTIYCHMIREANYGNNIGMATITVPTDAATKGGNIGPGTASAAEPSLNAKMPNTY